MNKKIKIILNQLRKMYIVLPCYFEVIFKCQLYLFIAISIVKENIPVTIKTLYVTIRKRKTNSFTFVINWTNWNCSIIHAVCIGCKRFSKEIKSTKAQNPSFLCVAAFHNNTKHCLQILQTTHYFNVLFSRCHR